MLRVRLHRWSVNLAQCFVLQTTHLGVDTQKPQLRGDVHVVARHLVPGQYVLGRVRFVNRRPVDVDVAVGGEVGVQAQAQQTVLVAIGYVPTSG
jgi:hypothetical protein